MVASGTIVNYSTTGLCEVVETQTRCTTGTEIRYYVLKPLSRGNSTVLVPVDNPLLVARMRPVVQPETLRGLLTEERPLPDWITDNAARGEAFHTVLQQGSEAQLVALCRVLLAQRDAAALTGKHLRSADAAVLDHGLRLLCEEAAYVLNLDESAVKQLLRGSKA